MVIDTILSKVEIQDLTVLHCRAIDQGNVDEYLATWVSGGELVIDGRSLRGHAALCDYLDTLSSSEQGSLRRLVSNFSIKVQTIGQATQRCYLLIYPLLTTEPSSLLVCNDQLVRENDGWKFKQRVVQSCSQQRKRKKAS